MGPRPIKILIGQKVPLTLILEKLVHIGLKFCYQFDAHKITPKICQQPTTPTPEASGDQGEKLFTQADLDRIIGERLAVRCS